MRQRLNVLFIFEGLPLFESNTTFSLKAEIMCYVVLYEIHAIVTIRFCFTNKEPEEQKHRWLICSKSHRSRSRMRFVLGHVGGRVSTCSSYLRRDESEYTAMGWKMFFKKNELRHPTAPQVPRAQTYNKHSNAPGKRHRICTDMEKGCSELFLGQKFIWLEKIVRKMRSCVGWQIRSSSDRRL